MKRAAVVALLAAGTALAAAAPAPAARAKRAPTPSYPLTIATVPRLADVRFRIAGQTFASGHDGVARTQVPAGANELQLLDRAVQRNGVRSRFSRWGEDFFTPSVRLDVHGPVHLEVGFEQAVRVDFSFVDRSNRPVDLGRVGTVTLTSTIGSRTSFVPTKPQWLIASRVARRFNGLEQTRIQYAVQRADFDGSNVVHKAQQRFYPSASRHVVVHLLLYSARLATHDLLFGFPVGRRLDLVYPDGRKVSFPLKGHPLLLRSLPRGTYGIKVHAWGYAPSVPLALSKDQVIDLRVISYLDMVVIVLAAAAVTALLILLRRPQLRRRVVEWWRRSTGWRRSRGLAGKLHLGGPEEAGRVCLRAGTARTSPPEPPEPAPEEPGRPAWSTPSSAYRAATAAEAAPAPQQPGAVEPARCRRGHELTPENVYTRPRGNRQECRTCRREDRARQRARRSALRRAGGV